MSPWAAFFLGGLVASIINWAGHKWIGRPCETRIEKILAEAITEVFAREVAKELAKQLREKR